MVRESETREAIGARLLISGRVQGVGYRYFTQGHAEALGLRGWARNLPDESVECYVEGPRSAIRAFIERLQEGPAMSRVQHIAIDWQSAQNTYDMFSIIS
jgi:acylphosphatase